MPRLIKKTKPYVVVFCEGESEQAYTDFLKNEFKDVAVIKRASCTGLFKEADNKFKKDKNYRDNAEITDEIWFFFDVEIKDKLMWDSNMKIIKHLRKLRNKPNIRVRLLMTRGCVEYWFLLHYEMCSPTIQTVAEKQHVMECLLAKQPNYKKGDSASTYQIAMNYPTAVSNSTNLLRNLLQQGLPSLEDTDARNRWLCQNCFTFSTVHEAIAFLTSRRTS